MPPCWLKRPGSADQTAQASLTFAVGRQAGKKQRFPFEHFGQLYVNVARFAVAHPLGGHPFAFAACGEMGRSAFKKLNHTGTRHLGGERRFRSLPGFYAIGKNLQARIGISLGSFEQL